MTVNGVDMSIINNMISQINAQKASLAGQIDKAKADFGDDGLFNGTVDGAIGSTDLTMEKVQNMSFEEITELLNTASDEEIKASLDEEENKLAKYLAEFDKIQNELNQLETQLQTLQNELETLQTEKRNEEAKLRSYETRKEIAEGEVSSARAAYELAKTRKADAMEDAENAAYEAAMEEYSDQLAAAARVSSKSDDNSDNNDNNDKKEDDKSSISFASILASKRNAAGISSSYDSAISSAAQNLADAKAEVKRYDRLINAQTAVIEAKVNEIRLKQTAITNKNSEITSKGNELTPVSNKIQESQNNITALQQTMAVRNFINENQEAILDVAYEKDPEAIAARNTIDNASDAINGKDGEQGYLQIAANAEAAAAEAAKNGDVATAEAKKQEAEEAKRLAEEEKAKADAAKASIVSKYGETRTKEHADKADGLEEKVTAIQTSAANAATSAVNAGIVSTSLATVTASLATVQEQISIANAANQAAATAMAEGDVVTAEAKKQEAEEAKRKADEAQRAAQEAAQKLQELNANDKKTAELNTINSLVNNYSSAAANAKQVGGSSPLSFDLNGDGIRTSASIVDFDINGDGTMDKISDSADAVLVFDKDGDGISGEDGSECFGNNTDLNNDGQADGYADGFAALRALALTEGLINNADDMVLDASDIAALEAKYGLRIKLGGYNSAAQKLSDNGITAINLSTGAKSTQNNFDGYGNQLMTQEGATFVQNGATKSYGDIWHVSQADRAANIEAAATREAAGVTFATTTTVTGETVKDVSRLDLTQMISPAELALVKANGVNLTDVVEVTINGQKGYYPRYIIAKGADGNFHIYERSVDKKGKPNTTLTSLARKYGKNGGYNIIKSGSGYMTSTKEVEEGSKGAKEVYFITCANDDFSSCEFCNTFKSYGTCSPLSLDLNGDGVKTSADVVDFDIDGDGQMDQINDSADAVLVFDKDGDGVSGEDGTECFGNNTDLDGDGIADGYADGFEALKALALREGLINNADDMELDENDLKYLEEKVGLKIKAGGYNDNAQSLSVFGITTINLARTNETTLNRDFDGMGNNLLTQAGATFVQNGVLKEYADIWHKKADEVNPFAA